MGKISIKNQKEEQISTYLASSKLSESLINDEYQVT